MKFKATSAEMDILSLIWKFGPSKVKKINEALNERKEVGYTTTLKIMQIMTEKGLLKREKDGKSHIYSSAIDQDSSQKDLLDRLVESAFGGSRATLVMQLLSNERTSKEEIDEIRSFLKKMEKGK